MHAMTPLMIAAPPALLLGVATVSILHISKRAVSDRARLNLLRGLLVSLGAGIVAYLVVQTILLARNNFQSLTPVAWLPLVVFTAATACAVWHMRNIQRLARARAQADSSQGSAKRRF